MTDQTISKPATKRVRKMAREPGPNDQQATRLADCRAAHTEPTPPKPLSKTYLILGMLRREEGATRIDLHEEGIDLAVDQAMLAKALGLEFAEGLTDPRLVITLPATKVRRGHQLRLVVPGPQTIKIAEATRDEKLVALVAEAHDARKLILAESDKSIASIAANNGRCRTRLGKLVGLSCMAPDIVTAIVEGRQPPTLTARALQDIDLPLAWADQRTLLGVN